MDNLVPFSDHDMNCGSFGDQKHFHNLNTVPYPYSNALFTTQDTYSRCLNMGTLPRSASFLTKHVVGVNPSL